MKRLLLCISLMALLQGCAGVSVTERQQYAAMLIEQAGWQSEVLKTPEFALFSARPLKAPGINTATEPLIIFIEGDGLAWVSRNRPSLNPTPISPLALELALNMKDSGPVAYLARPCQYVKDARCEKRYWTSARFAPEVIRATDAAIDRLKANAQAQQVVLVGYSGGGAVAALVAARRHDIAKLITLAGNLDTDYWAQLKQITPLYGSLNPADAWQALASIPQIHYVGAKDTIVPPAVAEAYQKRFPASQQPEVQVMEDYDHHCCWHEIEAKELTK
ncbi:alpha/beta hydrolase [Marinomonas ostreistagni]|uniref:alpha/beta hydrolase n=1 Tax=Marinomonas ostreistagni TaxID=359209 RepID=UPI00194FD32E|nr:alpha/beta hydrolase [Marinomonas ostreistagni]MBM6551042.1 alpha/beta hydrolase [Marinomonas ostreistagni]